MTFAIYPHVLIEHNVVVSVVYSTVKALSLVNQYTNIVVTDA